MAMVSPIYSLRFTLRICVVYLLMDVYSAQLSSTFYKNSCPKARSTIKSTVKSVVANEPRMGASLLRLHFHDCFVDGCEGSILLDDNSTFLGEKTAFPNINSVRGYEVIDKIKSKVEKICPGVVSCADIVTLAARDSVVALGGPRWNVLLGRRDSTTANWAGANAELPAPFLGLSALISAFSNKGFSVTDMVALSGAHTIGQAQCTTFRDRIYNDTDIDSSFAATRQSNCPAASGSGDSNLSPLDLQTPNAFDNKYYKNLLRFKGLLHSDQQLYGNKSTDSKVLLYESHPSAFFADFAAAMVKMSNLSPLTGSAGQIRTNCRVVN